MTTKFEQYIHGRYNLPYDFQTTHNLCREQIKQGKHTVEQIVEMGLQCRPIALQCVINLIEEFIKIKLEIGSDNEKQLYLGMTTETFITRIFSCRPLVFYTENDEYVTRNKTSGRAAWHKIETADLSTHLSLTNYLSYDEMQISALFGLSGPTAFINKGSRYNQGLNGEINTFEETGIYTAVVGARFEQPDKMESKHMHIHESSSTDNKLDELWARFYGQINEKGEYAFPTFDKADFAYKNGNPDKKYILLPNGRGYLNREVYKKRIGITILTFLQEANYQASKVGKKAYCHVVGLGLGVWKIHDDQENAMLEVYDDILSENYFPHIADIDFSWFSESSAIGTRLHDGAIITNNANEIKIHISRREPAAKLDDINTGKLLVAMFAWDSNAFVGNEYWLPGKFGLTASGDPAAACCSTIPEMLNPDCNDRISGRYTTIFEDSTTTS